MKHSSLKLSQMVLLFVTTTIINRNSICRSGYLIGVNALSKSFPFHNRYKFTMATMGWYEAKGKGSPSNTFFTRSGIIQYASNDNELFTTNAEDQEEAAKLQERLAQSNAAAGATPAADFKPVPSVCIDEGAHKYVQISAKEPKSTGIKLFVVSKRGAPYHRNVAEPFVARLERNGYQEICILGGGRIFMDESEKKVSIFGFSYGFGKAAHELSKEEVEKDARFADFEVTCSDEGY